MTMRFDHRSPDAPMGRFGGGWQWALGLQAGRLSRSHGTVLVRLIVCTLRIEWGAR